MTMPVTTEAVPDWAIERVEHLQRNAGDATVIATFARYVAEYEKNPTEPLLIEARRVVAEWNDARGYPSIASDTRAGLCDAEDEIEIALAALKRGMGLAKIGGAS